MAGATETSTGLVAWPRIALALAPALALLAYWNSLGGEFVWDDRTLILDGNLGGAWGRLDELFTSNFFYRAEFEPTYGYYRPVTTLSYVLDYWIWGLQPFGYHLTNVLLHASCSVWVGLILMRLEFDSGPAILAALLFAVHPIHTESVAWISGRTDLLAFFFCSFATLTHLATSRLRKTPDRARCVDFRRAQGARPPLYLSTARLCNAAIGKKTCASRRGGFFRSLLGKAS